MFSLRNLAFLGGLVAVIERFTSLYESFQELTSVQVTHMQEDFSGNDYDKKRWTEHNDTGTPTYVIDDIIDGGLKITCTSELNASAALGTSSAWNGINKRHYAHNGSIYIDVFKNNSAQANGKVVTHGFSKRQRGDAAGEDSALFLTGSAASAFFQTKTINGASSQTLSATTVAYDQVYHAYKIDCQASNVYFDIDGVEEVDQTATLPSAGFGPVVGMQGATGGSPSCSVMYMETYNTSISILSSIYERLSAFTQVLRQRMREPFVGSSINTDRWVLTNNTGSNSFTIDDAVNSGAKLTTAGASGDTMTLNLGTVTRKWVDEADSVWIAVTKNLETTNIQHSVGTQSLTSSVNFENAAVINSVDASSSFFQLVTSGVGADTNTNTTIALDTNWHLLSCISGASDVIAKIDGVEEAENTTNLPVTRSNFNVKVKSTTAATRTMNVRMVEVYNKLATETDYPNINSLFNDDTTISLSHFWEWFSGALYDSFRWTLTGGGTAVIQDSVDGGVLVQSTAGANNKTSLNHNNKHQFAHDNSEMIAVARQSNTTWYTGAIGFSDSQTDDGTDLALFEMNELNTFIKARSADATTPSSNNTTVATDTTWHSFKIKLQTGDIEYWIDGVLEDEKSTNKPTVKQQIIIFAQQGGGKVGDIQCRYVEGKGT